MTRIALVELFHIFICRGVGWGRDKGSRLEAWMKSHKSEVAIA